MVEFELKVHPTQRVTWLPKQLIEAWGFRLKLLPNNSAAILYPAGADYCAVIRSVEILLEILETLRLRADMKQTSQSGTNEHDAMKQRPTGIKAEKVVGSPLRSAS